MGRAPNRGLRLVRTVAKRPVNPSDFAAVGEHSTLFTTRDPSVLAFVDFDALSEAEFVSLIVSAAPKLIFDLRTAPRFDVGSLNRRLVFSLFQNVGGKYFDVSAAIGVSRTRQMWAGVSHFVEALRDTGMKMDRPIDGPILFLADADQLVFPLMDGVAHGLGTLNPRGWKATKIPEIATEAALGVRRTIFISHATPDDNDFARWLSAQLTLAGYDVWTDFERLRGGEVFWDTIEDVIRNRCSRVIVAATRLAQSRNGVLDEVNLAVSVERALGVDGFVIPLRVDDMPYSEFRANIARKNIIDFSDNWAKGLSSLLDALDAGGVRKSAVEADASVVFHRRLDTSSHLVEVNDTLLLNWLPVLGRPTKMYAYRLTGASGKLNAASKTVNVPHVWYAEYLITFAEPAQLRSVLTPGLSAESPAVFLTSEWDKGRVGQFPNLRVGEARRIMVNLLRQGWERFARSKGLQAFQLGSKNLAWFPTDGVIPGNKIAFRSLEGTSRRKSLVGHSRKRAAFWHFAVEMKVAPGAPLRLTAKAHVIFTSDGKLPIASTAKMHALRRGFCKSWWNDRWRDLTDAFLFWLADGQAEIAIDMACAEPIRVSSTMMQMVCPVQPEAETRSLILDSDGGEDPDDSDLDEDEVASLWGETPNEVDLDA